MPSIFTKIVARELPAHVVWEDADHLAFLDIRPVQPGHTLVIPKREVPSLFDLSPIEYQNLWRAVRRVEARLKAKLGCKRVAVAVIGWEVPHVHVHLIPTNSIADVPMPPACGASPSEIAELARRFDDGATTLDHPIVSERTVDLGEE